MRIKFQPMPWLSVLTLICLGILISLGTWQYQRLHWKTNLIAEIDIAAEAPPLTDLTEMNALFSEEQPLDFRRVSLSGEFATPDLNSGEPFHLIMPDGKTLNWRLIQPYMTDSGVIFVATHIFANADKDRPQQAESGTQPVVGYARLVRKTSRFAPVSNPKTNHWYVFDGAPDLVDWTQAVQGQTTPVGYYIDRIAGETNAADLPVKKPELRNNHLDYMLTWYSFAFILLVIYFILHRRAGRLQFKD